MKKRGSKRLSNRSSSRSDDQLVRPSGRSERERERDELSLAAIVSGIQTDNKRLKRTLQVLCIGFSGVVIIMVGVIAMVSNNNPVESATTPGTCLPTAKGGTGCFDIEFLNKIYPIGAIYTSTSDVNPSTYLGGVWEEFGGGRTLVGVGDNGTTNYTNSEETGGADSVTLTIDQMPSHTHVQNAHNHIWNPQGALAWVGSGATGNGIALNGPDNRLTSSTTATNQNTGSDGAHENRSAYITVYFWKRVS